MVSKNPSLKYLGRGDRGWGGLTYNRNTLSGIYWVGIISTPSFFFCEGLGVHVGIYFTHLTCEGEREVQLQFEFKINEIK